MPSLYEITIPVFVSHLTTLCTLLDKAAAHAGSSATAQQELLDACLAEDMFKLPLQVQRAAVSAINVAVKVGGLESTEIGDMPQATFDDLQKLVKAAIVFISTATEENFAGKDQIPVVHTTPRGDLHFNATDYVVKFAIPQFFFHYTTAYDLMRFKGVQLGKKDFLGFNNPK